MLQLSSSLLNRPVMSLRTGTQVATILRPLINPNNLKIEGFYCQDRLENKQLILLYQDIRDLIPQGFVVDDHDVLAEPEELVRLKKIIDLDFNIMGKSVKTVSKHTVGKVNDYATEVTTMYIQKIYAAPSLLRNLTGGSLSIDRTQIVEITDKHIIINDLAGTTPMAATAVV